MSGPRRFRKKPVVIEAMQWTGDNLAEIAEFVGADPTGEDKDRFIYTAPDFDGHLHVVLRTIQGQQVGARPGEWIIPESKPGRAYPVDPDVFAETYDEVTDEVTDESPPKETPR